MSDIKLVNELDNLKQNFITTIDKLTKDLKRNQKIMDRTDN